MTQPSRLDDPEIRAVLEANRAKMAMMQAQKQAAAAGTKSNPTFATNTGDGIVGVSSVGLPKPAVGTTNTATTGGNLRSNPVFSVEEMLAPTPGPRLSEEYAPKLSGVLRTPPISGIASDAGLPSVGDLFSPQPALPLGLSIGSSHVSSTAAAAAQRVGGSYSAGSSTMISNEFDPIPHFAAWDSTRPYLSNQFLFNHAAELASGQVSAAPAQPLESYPPQVQESMLVDDLLHAFGGFEGTWIRPKIVDGRNGPRLDFRIVARGQLEPALLEMATRMLPLCECVAVVSRYAESRRRYEWGVVCQALAGAMRGVLHDWDLMIAQLEHQLREGKLTLQALWYYVQPPMAALKLVATVAAEASSRCLRGAGLLSLLHTKASALMGDADAHKLALRLLRAAAEPYFSMLEKWLTQGVVDDPYSEFMIQENFEINKSELSGDGGAAFWGERLVLRAALDPLTGAPIMKATTSGSYSFSRKNDASLSGSGGGVNSTSSTTATTTSTAGPAYDVPNFLERVQMAILDTGRCLNLISTCSGSGGEGSIPPQQQQQQQHIERTLPVGVRLQYDEGDRFLLHVEHAHKTAAAAALSLMRHEVGVSRGLAAIKRYFLAAQGDLFLGLMESGDADLNSVCGTVPLQQLQSVLDIAVRCSSAATDPAAARLKAAYDHRSVLNLLIAITQTAGPVTATDSPTKRPKLRPVVPTAMTAAEKSTVGRQRRARESFMLSYEVPWPLSIVVPDSAMAQYQMIFRHLFELKWVEKELNRVCSLYQTTRPLAVAQRRSAADFNAGRRLSTSTTTTGGGGVSDGTTMSAADAAAALSAAAPPPVANQALTRAYRTCQLMTHFFRQYLLYATFEVLEPLWCALELHIESAGSIDEIVDFHKMFLRRVMKGLLLSRKVVVLRSLLSLKQTALDFVALSCRHVDLDLSIFDGGDGPGSDASSSRAGSASAGGGGGGGGVSRGAGVKGKEAVAAAKRAKRIERESQIKSALNEALSNPEFSAGLNEYRTKFEARCSDFMSALAEAHRQARSERTDTREELEGLLNLMGRLDFNGYFARAGLGGVALAEEGLR
jgi:gamma-tubulin complex component 2